MTTGKSIFDGHDYILKFVLDRNIATVKASYTGGYCQENGFQANAKLNYFSEYFLRLFVVLS